LLSYNKVLFLFATSPALTVHGSFQKENILQWDKSKKTTENPSITYGIQFKVRENPADKTYGV